MFSEQPTLTEKNTIINGTTGVKVTVQDQFGNPRSGDSVAIAIGTNPSLGTLGGTLTRTTDASGVATFDDLTIDNPGLGYTLTATTGPASTTSIAFDIANDVNPCTGTCSAAGNTATTATNVDAFGLGAGGSARLSITVAGSVPIPADVCGPQLGDGSGVHGGGSGRRQALLQGRRTTGQQRGQEKAAEPGERFRHLPRGDERERRHLSRLQLAYDVEVVEDEGRQLCDVQERPLLGSRRQLPVQAQSCPTAPAPPSSRALKKFKKKPAT